MARITLFIAQALLASSALAVSSPVRAFCPVFYPRGQPPQACSPETPLTFIPYQLPPEHATGGSDPGTEALRDAFEALTVMQSEFFSPDQGTWLEAIDWTAAVMQTVLSGSLTSLSQAFSTLELTSKDDKIAKRNLVDSFFTQIVSSYFGQDALSIRHQVSTPISTMFYRHLTCTGLR